MIVRNRPLQQCMDALRQKPIILLFLYPRQPQLTSSLLYFADLSIFGFSNFRPEQQKGSIVA